MVRSILKKFVKDGNRLTPIVFYLLKLKSSKLHNWRLLRTMWLDEHPGKKSGILRKGYQCASVGPKFINVTDNDVDIPASRSTVLLPDIFYREFAEAVIAIDSSSLVIDNTLLIERAGRGDQSDFDYSAGHIVSHGQKQAVVRMGETRSIEQGLFLGGNGVANYYHWLMEIMPRCEFFAALPKEYDDFPIIVSDSAAKWGAFKEILDRLVTDREIIYVDPAASYKVERLVYIDTQNTIPFNLHSGSRFDCNHSLFFAETFSYLRSKMLTAADSVSANNPERIFLCRKGVLRDYNQTEIIDFLRALDFVPIYLDDHALAKQVEMVSQAKWIVGPTGAAWANLLFAFPKAKCLCWMAEELGDFSVYSNMATLVQADLYYLTYQSGGKTAGEHYRNTYSIDIPQIKRALNKMGLAL